MSSTKEVQLIKNGKRLDGRAVDQLKPISIKLGVLNRADGSCFLEWGGNKVVAGVFGPRECHPKHKQTPYRAVLSYRYNMAPFSVDDRKRPGFDRRSIEIGKISREALENVVMLEQFPRTKIDVSVEILQADAGTRCAALTAASLALADAGIPMKDLVVSCAAGKINGEIAVDLSKEEDNFGEADMPIAITPRTGEVVLMQADGQLTKEEFKKAFEFAKKGCMEIYELQKKALKEKYGKETGGEQ